MDSLERQMEHQRQEIQRTLEQIEGSGRRWTALQKLRSSLPSIPGRASGTSVQGAREREASIDKPTGAKNQSVTGGPQEGVQWPWWRRMLDG